MINGCRALRLGVNQTAEIALRLLVLHVVVVLVASTGKFLCFSARQRCRPYRRRLNPIIAGCWGRRCGSYAGASNGSYNKRKQYGRAAQKCFKTKAVRSHRGKSLGVYLICGGRKSSYKGASRDRKLLCRPSTRPKSFTPKPRQPPC